MSKPSSRLRRAFTLVELLVVIAIIGILVALLLPAVNAARAAARRTHCVNNLRQLALGCMTHESSIRHYPTGGWGDDWVGDPDRGFGKDQPGGWIFNLMPFIEEGVLHDMASDGKPDEHTPEQLEGARQTLLSPLPIINCPARRASGLFTAGDTANAKNAGNVSQVALVGRGDYAASVGDGASGNRSGPPSLEIVNLGFFQFLEQDLSGIMWHRSEIAIKHVKDGTSKTYLCGEHYLNPDHYFTGEDSGDNETWCTGANNDNYRPAATPPRPDRPGLSLSLSFGSAHPAVWHMAWGDGHVTGLSYEIDPQVHRNNANRRDGRSNIE